MEKRTPHCPLERVQVLLSQGKVRSTRAAIQGAHALGLQPRQILDVVRALMPSDFYKSMTTYHDHRLWQDVYHVHAQLGWIYVKLTVVDDVLVVSFKEL
ncbi:MULTISPECIES: type II toxin-antitoxin system MqsR family toxin [unclassified Pseudomonas]|uniref:type II toxin-antitoxin system MqsR family toxin n=1 Tax=unclassified Pseudomonas TaxID=196821 RepID=UPI002447730B|nr:MULTISPECIES: type II toxin-antitoxin system MqsR family toxin [unclassified Pseudomonas]MDH0300182.1 type II toxin-antitoxin system MqsR family toxin [Pseudomonas sp. GD04091]MDH1987457.1 type II toxin-antitoxin system MqsR family toxin [Pseudomonas sp. GD03689]